MSWSRRNRVKCRCSGFSGTLRRAESPNVVKRLTTVVRWPAFPHPLMPGWQDWFLMLWEHGMAQQYAACSVHKVFHCVFVPGKKVCWRFQPDHGKTRSTARRYVTFVHKKNETDATIYEGNTKSLFRHVQRSNRSWLQRTMLWWTSTKPDRSKVLNMTEKTFSITLVYVSGGRRHRSFHRWLWLINATRCPLCVICAYISWSVHNCCKIFIYTAEKVLLQHPVSSITDRNQLVTVQTLSGKEFQVSDPFVSTERNTKRYSEILWSHKLTFGDCERFFPGKACHLGRGSNATNENHVRPTAASSEKPADPARSNGFLHKELRLLREGFLARERSAVGGLNWNTVHALVHLASCCR